MAYIAMFPKSAEAERRLAHDSTLVMALLYQATKDIFHVPDHDIIVELNRCTTIAFNATAVENAAVPDVVIKIATSDPELQPQFQALCDEIVSRWDEQFEKTFKMELWASLIDAWSCNMDFDQA